jgi:hypothetical protein
MLLAQIFTIGDISNIDETTQPPLRDLDLSMLKDQHIHPADLSRFLRHCQRPRAAPYVHLVPLSFPTKANKDNWRTAFVGAANLDTYLQFWKASSTANTQIGPFSTWNATWVGDLEWDTRC